MHAHGYCCDSVNIDVDAWLREASLAEDATRQEVAGILVSRKRASPAKPALPPAKKQKTEGPARSASVALSTTSETKTVKLSKAAQKLADEARKEESWACALCPDLSTEGLVRIGEPGVKSKKALKAHRICVIFTRRSFHETSRACAEDSHGLLAASTWIDEDPDTHEEIVRGYGKIEKARWRLVRLFYSVFN